jgi:hypothetical protein
MTWHTFFDFSTLESRHLLASYGVIFLLQGGYFVWMVLNWRSAKNPRS